MHAGAAMPAVRETAPMRAVVAEISAKGLGMACVVGEDGRLAGIITDGDLRRHMGLADLLTQPASAVMTAGPQTIGRAMLAVQALALMEQRKITSLVVVDAERRVEGVLHLHDLWRTQMF
jgi:arabinose-5-phosphate isomerase